MATTYTRIKNRRGLRSDLPQPLADGEIGLAIDTRELYIGAGTQDLLNSDVQVTSFVNAEKVIDDDLTNLDSGTTNNGLLFFNLTGTQTFTGNGTDTNSYDIGLTANVTIPTGKAPIGSSYESQDFVVTKYINGNPNTLDNTAYSIVNDGGNYQLQFVTAPESGSEICVVKWTESQTREHARARAGWEASNSAVSSYNKWQEQDLANNQVWIDVTTGTGMAQFVTAGEKTSLETANANDGINTIAEPGTYSFLGENLNLGHVVRDVNIDSSLRIDLDTPQQAYNVQRFINKKHGQVSRVANNIQIYTEASFPQYQTNQYVSYMQTAELGASSNGTMLEYLLAECNVYNIDYSLKIDSKFRNGTILIATDGTNATINDNFVETGDTSAVSFAAAISSSKLQWNWTNSDGTNAANLSYKIERWLQS